MSVALLFNGSIAHLHVTPKVGQITIIFEVLKRTLRGLSTALSDAMFASNDAAEVDDRRDTNDHERTTGHAQRHAHRHAACIDRSALRNRASLSAKLLRQQVAAFNDYLTISCHITGNTSLTACTIA